LKNIKGRFTSGLKAVMQLQPWRYEYKRDNALNLKSEGEHVGFSAQAVQKIIPEAVTSTEQGYLLVNNDPILWTMLNAIKEQQAQIQKQTELIERQQALANRQQRELDTLKKLSCQSHWRARVCQK
jgi:trimeric autotransporter adhesin